MNAQHKSSFYKFVGGRGGTKASLTHQISAWGGGHGPFDPSLNPPLNHIKLYISGKLISRSVATCISFP